MIVIVWIQIEIIDIKVNIQIYKLLSSQKYYLYILNILLINIGKIS